MQSVIALSCLLSLLAAAVGFAPRASAAEPEKAEAKADIVQGTLTASPDEKGTLSVQPQGTRAKGDIVRVATDEKTIVFLGQAAIKVADLKAGMWTRTELANGVAAKIAAGHIVTEDGDQIVLFKGLPEAFFLHPGGFDVRAMPIKFGPLTMMYRLAGNGCWLRFGGQRPQEGSRPSAVRRTGLQTKNPGHRGLGNTPSCFATRTGAVHCLLPTVQSTVHRSAAGRHR